MAGVDTSSSSIQVLQPVGQPDIAEGYFGSILAAQTGIFSTIVLIIVALYFFFNWKVTKEQIKKEADVHFRELKDQIEKESNERTLALKAEFAAGMQQHDTAITSLNGQTYRTLGEFWDSQKSYATAFIWWFRAAHKFALTGEDKLARICLSSAKESVERVSYGFQLDTDSIGEYQSLITEIGDLYKIEKDLLDNAIKDVLGKKPSTTP